MAKHFGNNLSKQDYCVQSGLTPKSYKPLVERYHYTGSCSTANVFAFGLFHMSTGSCLGVALYMAQRKSAALSLWPGDHKRVLCLSRVAIHPCVPRNGASFLIAATVREIRSTGHYDCLTTYADTGEGHTGTIYKACGWEFMGETPPRPVWKDNKGHRKSRKQGRYTRSVEEMNNLGFFLQSEKVVKLKYRKVL